MIRGESGTGKELVARAIHFNSPRQGRRFVAVDCGALHENLLESELFGHVKGAFTGATSTKKGLFEAADGGSLFLDEIGHTSLALQARLLRVLQERVYTPVGDTRERKTDVRLIAATNRDVDAMVAHGCVPPGTVLSTQYHADHAASAAQTEGRYPGPGRPLSQEVL